MPHTYIMVFGNRVVHLIGKIILTQEHIDIHQKQMGHHKQPHQNNKHLQKLHQRIMYKNQVHKIQQLQNQQ